MSACRALNTGADDYLDEAVFVEELDRAGAGLLRRVSGEKLSLLQAGRPGGEPETREVKVGERRVELTARECRCVVPHARAGARLHPHGVAGAVWSYDFDTNTNLIDVYIQRLRKKLDPAGEQQIVETIRGVGYRFRRPK